MSKAKKTAPAGGGKAKKAPGFGKERLLAGGGSPAPLASFEDDDMYQEPIKKVTTVVLFRDMLFCLFVDENFYA